MFLRSAAFYDAIYASKDYAAEADYVLEWAARYQRTPANRLLDMACGTGRHAEHFARTQQVIGLDLDEGLLQLARQRLPEVEFLRGDMRTARFDSKFDLITCLFSAIGYMQEADLPVACANFYRHLEPGGVVLIEPWLRPETFRPGNVGIDQADCDGLKLVRMGRIQVDGNISLLQFHYLMGSAQEIRYETEEHRLTLFTLDQYQRALEQAGFEFHWDEQGPSGRGLLIGVKPTDLEV